MTACPARFAARADDDTPVLVACWLPAGHRLGDRGAHYGADGGQFWEWPEEWSMSESEVANWKACLL